MGGLDELTVPPLLTLFWSPPHSQVPCSQRTPERTHPGSEGSWRSGREDGWELVCRFVVQHTLSLSHDGLLSTLQAVAFVCFSHCLFYTFTVINIIIIYIIIFIIFLSSCVVCRRLALIGWLVVVLLSLSLTLSGIGFVGTA